MTGAAFLCAAALVALVTYDVTHTGLFRRSRIWFCRILCRRRSRWRFRELVRCHWCLSHWVAMAALAISPLALTGGLWDYPLTWAGLVLAAQPMILLIDWSIDAMDAFWRLFGRGGRPMTEIPETDIHVTLPGAHIVLGPNPAHAEWPEQNPRYALEVFLNDDLPTVNLSFTGNDPWELVRRLVRVSARLDAAAKGFAVILPEGKA